MPCLYCRKMCCLNGSRKLYSLFPFNRKVAAKIMSFSGISKFLFQKTCITEAGTILTDDASLELHIYTHIFFTNTLTAAKIGETAETE